MTQLAATGLPAPLAEQAERAWANILERAPDAARLEAQVQAGPAAQQLSRVLATSPCLRSRVNSCSR